MKKIVREALKQWQRDGDAVGIANRAFKHFVTAYFDGVPAEDLNDRSTNDLAGVAIAHLRQASTWRRGRYRVRVFNPSLKSDGWQSTHTVVQAVTLDRPFLVDTLTMVINERGFTNHLVVHPVIGIVRDDTRCITDIIEPDEKADEVRSESFIHIEIDRETDKSRLQNLRADLERSLHDVAAAVDDWPRMLERIGDEAWQLKDSNAGLSRAQCDESAAFLHWILAGNMMVLGVREYKMRSRGKTRSLRIESGSGLGVLRDNERVDVSGKLTSPSQIATATTRKPELIVLAKSDSRSTVHRAGYLDFIGIRRFAKNGTVEGELRIVGLYTSSAYIESPRAIPLVRQKIQTAIRHIGLDPQGYDGRAFFHILDTYPRAELFEADVATLTETALGVLHLQERQRVRVFIRSDQYSRYFACLVYVPRDHFDTRARQRIQEILRRELHGDSVEFTVNLSESPLARLYIVVHCASYSAPRVSVREIEKHIADAVQPWTTALQSALMETLGEEAGLDLAKQYADSFPVGYRDDHRATEAVADIPYIEAALGDSRIRVRIVASDSDSRSFVFKLFSPDRIVEISQILPILENMNVKVALEHPYEITLETERRLWIHDYECTLKSGLKSIRPALRDAFHEAVSAAWYGDIENDQLNSLVLTTRLSARRITVLRAYARYLRQTGTPYGLGYINNAIAGNPGIAQLLADLFEDRFEPRAGVAQRAHELRKQTEASLDAVASLDEDRILRSIYQMILASVRTNYFQNGEDGEPKRYLSIKFIPEFVPGIPDPKPAFEIFVYSPSVEGVHLRGGKVARGGLRWSDRREDYRTEILGLMKAQTVKNAVIVPVGAKGGFVSKKPLHQGRPQQQGLICYRTFIRGLLDLTDNYVDGQIVPPPKTVRYDDDDPYLVVAADKGTATFSDTANELAAEYQFWLADAFASGGSAGYDHKKMGITARGAWESVRHHGEILDVNVDRDDFRVVGVGDMSGDVFGNGMLLSRHICLIAAFNHQHIFIDPDPDPVRSLTERRRLFRLHSSTWNDYNLPLISGGGGVYSRAVKSIALSPAARSALGIDAERLTPDELISGILRAPVDLFWNGGIGTYVKAKAERHEDVGDKSNDRVRVNAEELRCRMVGEGGNLGITQSARIELAAGGRLINSDWIDNSGGVDCSDREVNIKILLNREMSQGVMSLEDRNALLRRMGKEVAREVLDNNRAQARAISCDEVQSRDRVDWYRFTIGRLEDDVGINRELEILPSDDELRGRSECGAGIYRPELATLLAWAKIAVFRDLAGSSLVRDPYVMTVAERYFPEPLRERYVEAIREHPLRNEIVATVLANDVVNTMGISFAARLTGEAGVDIARVVQAWIIVHESFGLASIWHKIETSRTKTGFSTQCAMTLACRRAVESATRWLIRNLPATGIDATNGRYRKIREAFYPTLARLLSVRDAQRFADHRKALRAAGVVVPLARAVAALEFLPRVFPLADIAERTQVSFDKAAMCYAELDDHVAFSTIYRAIDNLPATDIWADRARVETAALATSLHINLTETAIRSGGAKVWVGHNRERITRLVETRSEFDAVTEPDLAKVLVLLNQMKTNIQT